MSVARIASRYAKTLIDLSIQEKKLERILEDVESFNSLTDESKDFYNFLKTPIIHKDKKQKIIKSLFEKSYDDLTMKFLLLLINRHREMYLPEIADEFILQYKILKHITTVRVTSAVELSQGTLKKIEDKLPSDTFLKVHRSYIINEKRIIDIEDNSVLIKQDIVPVSRANRSELMKRLNLL